MLVPLPPPRPQPKSKPSFFHFLFLFIKSVCGSSSTKYIRQFNSQSTIKLLAAIWGFPPSFLHSKSYQLCACNSRLKMMILVDTFFGGGRFFFTYYALAIQLLLVAFCSQPTLGHPQHFFAAPSVARGYQPPPNPSLVDEYSPYISPFQASPVPHQYQPRWLSPPPFSSPSTSFAFRPQIQQIPSSNGPSEPLLVNTLIQVFAPNQISYGRPAISLAEAHTLTAVSADGQDLPPNLGGGRLNGKKRVMIMRQLDTTKRIFIPEASINPAASPKEIAFVKAFAATNSTRMTDAQLKDELAKELDQSVPLILEELERVGEQKVTVGPSRGDVVGLISEGLAELEETTAKIGPMAEETEESATIGNGAEEEESATTIRQQPAEEFMTTKPLLVFTKNHRHETPAEGAEEFFTVESTTAAEMPSNVPENGQSSTPKFVAETLANEKGSSQKPVEEAMSTIEEGTSTILAQTNAEEISATMSSMASVPPESVGEGTAEIGSPTMLQESTIEGEESTAKTMIAEGSGGMERIQTTVAMAGTSPSENVPPEKEFAEEGSVSTEAAPSENIGTTSPAAESSTAQTIEGGTTEAAAPFQTNNVDLGVASTVTNNPSEGTTVAQFEGESTTGGGGSDISTESGGIGGGVTGTPESGGISTGGGGTIGTMESGSSTIAGGRTGPMENGGIGTEGVISGATDGGINTGGGIGTESSIGSSPLISGATESGISTSGIIANEGGIDGATESGSTGGDIGGATKSGGTGTNEFDSSTTQFEGGSSIGIGTSTIVAEGESTTGGGGIGTASGSGITESGTGTTAKSGTGMEGVFTGESGGITGENGGSTISGGGIGTESGGIGTNEFGSTTEIGATNEIGGIGSTPNAEEGEGWERTDFEEGQLWVRCRPQDIQARLRPSPNRTLTGGALFAKDFHDQPGCFAELEPDGTDARLEIGQGQCGLSSSEASSVGQNVSLVLMFAPRRSIILDSPEYSFLLQCFSPALPSQQQLSATLAIQQPAAAPILTKTIELELAPPKCEYSLRRDSPNGPLLESVALGQTIFHRWECHGAGGADAAQHFGIFLSDCLVANSSTSQGANGTTSAQPTIELVDSQGCSTDSAIFGDPEYADGALLATARAKAFSLRPEAHSLQFSCQLRICMRNTEGCQPPQCPATNSSSPHLEALALSRRHLFGSDHSALMPAIRQRILSTQISVIPFPSPPSSSSPPSPRLPFHGPPSIMQQRNLLNSGWAVGLILGAAILLGTLLGICTFLLHSRHQRAQRARLVQWVLARPTTSSANSAGCSENGSYYDLAPCPEEVLTRFDSPRRKGAEEEEERKPETKNEEERNVDHKQEMEDEKRPKNATENVANNQEEKKEKNEDDEHGRKPRS